MSVTVLDPQTALILIDLQKGIVALPTVHPATGVVEKSASLARAFRARGLPVVLVNVDATAPGRNEQGGAGQTFPAEWAELVPELEAQPSDLRVTKRTWGAFSGTDLAEQLARLAVTQVVVAGIASSMGVESTARQAHELGFNVALAIDAMTDLDLDTHINSTTRIFPRMAETTTTAEILALLERQQETA